MGKKYDRESGSRKNCEGGFCLRPKADGFVKSPIFMSFRAKRETLWEQAIEKIGFLPTVEMTNADFSTFCDIIKAGPQY
jgi:hypothetical protein